MKDYGYEAQQRGIALGYLGNVAGAYRCGLTDQQIAVLVVAGQRDYPFGHTEQRVLATFGWSLTTFTQHVNRLLDDPRALDHNPVLVNRLRRLRDARMARRGH